MEVELPSNFIIESVKSATAREYGVKVEELNSLKCICEDLIQEIIGNVYVSNENKKIYIENLEKYMKKSDNEKFDEQPKPVEEKIHSTRDSIISSVIGIIATILSVIISHFF